MDQHVGTDMGIVIFFRNLYDNPDIQRHGRQIKQL